MASPNEAKTFTVKWTLKKIVARLEPYWIGGNYSLSPTVNDEDTGSMSDNVNNNNKTLSYLLNIASCALALPPKSVHGPGGLDPRLLRALGTLCAGDPTLRRVYAEVGGGALKGTLEAKTLWEVCVVARDSGVDISLCETKKEVLKTLLETWKPLILTGGDRGGYSNGNRSGNGISGAGQGGQILAPNADVTTVQGFLPAVAVPEPGRQVTAPTIAVPVPRSPVVAVPRSPAVVMPVSPTPATRPHPRAITPSATAPESMTADERASRWSEFADAFAEALAEQVIGTGATEEETGTEGNIEAVAQVGAEVVAETDTDTNTDRDALMLLYRATGGPRWKNRSGWDTSAPLSEWHGVTVDWRGRVTELELFKNNLKGARATARTFASSGSGACGGRGRRVPIPLCLRMYILLCSLATHRLKSQFLPSLPGRKLSRRCTHHYQHHPQKRQRLGHGNLETLRIYFKQPRTIHGMSRSNLFLSGSLSYTAKKCRRQRSTRDALSDLCETVFCSTRVLASGPGPSHRLEKDYPLG